MKTSNITRADKKRQHVDKVRAQQTLWIIRLQEIMEEKRCDANVAFTFLRVETRAEYDAIRPQVRDQYKACWVDFKKKIAQWGSTTIMMAKHHNES